MPLDPAVALLSSLRMPLLVGHVIILPYAPGMLWSTSSSWTRKRSENDREEPRRRMEMVLNSFRSGSRLRLNMPHARVLLSHCNRHNVT